MHTQATNAHLRMSLVGIIMGSDSDLPTMSAACEILEQFEIPFEVDIVSAHRTPGDCAVNVTGYKSVSC